MAGKSIPQLYLLGAAKAGTTSIARDLFKAGFRSAQMQKQGEKPRKELQLFDLWCRWGSRECPMMTADKKQDWASHFTYSCGEKGLADCTPANFRYAGLPGMLKDLYGQSSRKLRFLVVLRDPISRMQAQFHYHYRDVKVAKYRRKQLLKIAEGKANQSALKHGEFENKPFQYYVDRLNASATRLQTLRDSSWDGTEFLRDLDFVYRSLYAAQLSKWLKVFPADQFTVLLMKKYFETPKAIRDLFEHLARTMAVEVDVRDITQASHKNSNSYPSLEKDFKLVSREWLAREVFDSDVRRLSQLLSTAIEGGLTLHGYEGEPTPESVHDFLIASW